MLILPIDSLDNFTSVGPIFSLADGIFVLTFGTRIRFGAETVVTFETATRPRSIYAFVMLMIKINRFKSLEPYYFGCISPLATNRNSIAWGSIIYRMNVMWISSNGNGKGQGSILILAASDWKKYSLIFQRPIGSAKPLPSNRNFKWRNKDLSKY